MKSIAGYVADYRRWVDQKLFFAVSFILAILIFLNYRYHIAATVNDFHFLPKFLLYDALFLFVYVGCWFGSLTFSGTAAPGRMAAPTDRRFYIMLVAAPAIFAIKIALPVRNIVRHLPVSDGINQFLQVVLQWPVKAALVSFLIIWCWKYLRNASPVAGLAPFSDDRVRPYFVLLLMMLPLILLAGTFPDFQKAYPKLHLIASLNNGPVPLWKALVFELSYGLDFFTIEFFFRGFLVLALANFAGKAAILPMAAFYCTIHFGKPLGECITSFFGGIILGAVVYNTRSVWGGLIVHLGIAWAMEAAGLLM
jgi:Type II CAAX prenyl endopeptidase Rce1-like